MSYNNVALNTFLPPGSPQNGRLSVLTYARRPRVSLHEHPFAARMGRVYREQGLSEVLGLDTRHLGLALPARGVEIRVDAGAGEVRWNLLSGLGPDAIQPRLGLNQSLQVTYQGQPYEVPQGSSIFGYYVNELAPGFSFTAKGSLELLIADAVDPAPSVGQAAGVGLGGFLLAPASVVVDSPFPAVAGLYGGGYAVPDFAVPIGTRLTLPRGTYLVLTAGQTEVTKSRRALELYGEFFEGLDPTAMVRQPWPVESLDFTPGGAYAQYNWELFVHLPLTIAVRLTREHRFKEAMDWLHTLFDPTDDSDEPTPARFWKALPFRNASDVSIEGLLLNLASGDDPELAEQTLQSIERWKANPFQPHAVARYRPRAYMYRVVMAYLDNLIAWGDHLFRQGTGEAIDEAANLYIMAASLLGPRPQAVPDRGYTAPQSYQSIRGQLGALGSVLVDLESNLSFDAAPTSTAARGDVLPSLRSVARALYFCVPRNEKLVGYWDTVADRLFKIRNSLDFSGRFRQLPLFEPPIDPAMLARAAAAGLDVGAVLSGLNQPLAAVRFRVLHQLAVGLAQEVRSLGGQVLSALEKEDAEQLTVLRAQHETAMAKAVERVRYLQLEEARKAREGLYASLDSAVERYAYYEQQLGRPRAEVLKSIPELEPIDREALAAMRLKLEEPSLETRPVEIDNSGDIAGDLGASRGVLVNSREAEELNKARAAQTVDDVATGAMRLAQALRLIPDTTVALHFWGVGGDVKLSGEHFAAPIQLGADVARSFATRDRYESGRASRLAGLVRRQEDWTFQSNLAALEIGQVLKQIRAAELREAAAEGELENHRRQMEHSEEVERFLNVDGSNPKGKVAGLRLYRWMRGELEALHRRAFQHAFDMAKKAERALQHELGDATRSFLRYDYMSGPQSLLTGERLAQDLQRMQTSYYELNTRDYELTKHVSLRQVDPHALLLLQKTGRCEFAIPEALYDLDTPGHYFRRIKSVSVSLPAVTGPYVGVPCRVMLQASTIRKESRLLDGEYGRVADDPRFEDYNSRSEAIVTSSGQSDGGLFEVSLADERYLPFENAGVISRWRIDLPADPPKAELQTFDYASIGDLVLHIRYTAREGGEQLKAEAKTFNRQRLESVGASTRLFSLRDEFPESWSRYMESAGAPYTLSVGIEEAHYPFWASFVSAPGVALGLIVESTGSSAEAPTTWSLSRDGDGSLVGGFIKDAQDGLYKSDGDDRGLSSRTGQFVVGVDAAPTTVGNIWLAVRWPYDGPVAPRLPAPQSSGLAVGGGQGMEPTGSPAPDPVPAAAAPNTPALDRSWTHSWDLTRTRRFAMPSGEDVVEILGYDGPCRLRLDSGNEGATQISTEAAVPGLDAARRPKLLSFAGQPTFTAYQASDIATSKSVHIRMLWRFGVGRVFEVGAIPGQLSLSGHVANRVWAYYHHGDGATQVLPAQTYSVGQWMVIDFNGGPLNADGTGLLMELFINGQRLGRLEDAAKSWVGVGSDSVRLNPTGGFDQEAVFIGMSYGTQVSEAEHQEAARQLGLPPQGVVEPSSARHLFDGWAHSYASHLAGAAGWVDSGTARADLVPYANWGADPSFMESTTGLSDVGIGSTLVDRAVKALDTNGGYTAPMELSGVATHFRVLMKTPTAWEQGKLVFEWRVSSTHWIRLRKDHSAKIYTVGVQKGASYARSMGLELDTWYLVDVNFDGTGGPSGYAQLEVFCNRVDHQVAEHTEALDLSGSGTLGVLGDYNGQTSDTATVVFIGVREGAISKAQHDADADVLGL